MTYTPLWAKGKRTSSWYSTIITPLLRWHSNLLWLSPRAGARFLSQSVVIRPKISPEHLCALLNWLRGKWVTWAGSAISLSKGRAAADTSSCLEARSRPGAEGARHSTEEISTFHQKGGSGWMASDKSSYWVFSDFQERVAMEQSDCMHSLFTSHCLLFITQKKVVIRLYFPDFHGKKERDLSATCIHLKSLSGAAGEKSILSCDWYAADYPWLKF